MNVADRITMPDKDIARRTSLSADDTGDYRRGSGTELDQSPKVEATDAGFDDEAEPYGKGNYDHTSQAHGDAHQEDTAEGMQPCGEGDHEESGQTHNDAHQEVAEGVQGSSTHSDNAEHEGMGGVKEWISNKLLRGGKPMHKHEGQGVGDSHDSNDAVDTGEQGDTHGSGSEPTTEPTTDSGAAVRSFSETSSKPVGEPTTDSGSAVRSFSEGPARSYTIAPMGEESGEMNATVSQASESV